MNNVALVLSSGGARGIAQIGAIDELLKHGFSITSISGSSIGSLIGGFYASGKLNVFSEWVCSLKRIDVFKLMDFTLSNKGIIKAEKVFKKMETIIPDKLIEDMDIPFAAVTTDIIYGKELIFTQGSFYKAVRASIAIPTIITSIYQNDTLLVDGGVLNPIPVKYVRRNFGDILVVVNLYHDQPIADPFIMKDIYNSLEIGTSEKSIIENRISNNQNSFNKSFQKGDNQNQGYFKILNLTTSLMTKRIADLQLDLYRPDIVINIPRNSAGTFDFHKSKQLIEEGKISARKSIEEYYLKMQ